MCNLFDASACDVYINVMCDANVIEFLKKVAKEVGASKVVLFGSRARGDAKETSDYDVVFYGITGKQHQAEVRYALDWNAPTLCSFDVIFDDEIPQELCENIKIEGKIIYEKGEK